jgi:methionyl-tRNA formyltransferase
LGAFEDAIAKAVGTLIGEARQFKRASICHADKLAQRRNDLLLVRVQPEGKGPMPAADWMRGRASLAPTQFL